MTAELRRLLDELKSRLQGLYGPRLRGLYVFGSYSRDASEDESDVDVLVVLDEIHRYGAEIDRTSVLASELSLKYGVTVSRVFLSERDWLTGDSPFLRSVRPEAVPA